VELFFSHFSVIDVHDHLRQGSLAIENFWYTHKWWHRVFGTILGIIITNAFYCYRYEYQLRNHGDDTGSIDFATFLAKLAHGLIFNSFIENFIVVRDNNHDNQLLVFEVSGNYHELLTELISKKYTRFL